MAGLLADGWFYISSAGLLVSGVLFFFLLGQYRAATDAADRPEPEAAAELQAPLVRPLSIPDGTASSRKVASFSEDKPAEKAPTTPLEPNRDAASAPAEKRREAAGVVNPAVVYLQNIKNQLEELHHETRELSKRVDAISGRDEALIERLTELAQAVAELKSSNVPAAAPVEPPAPRRAKRGEAPAASVSVVKTEAPAVAAAAADATEAPPVAAPATLSIVPSAVAAAPKPKDEPEPAAEAPLVPAELFAPAAAPEEPESGEKPRRGPVWPV